jgi:catenin alpha
LQVCEAVNTISDVAKGNQPQGGQSSFEGPGALAAALDDFDTSILMNPLTYNEVKTRCQCYKTFFLVIDKEIK